MAKLFAVLLGGKAQGASVELHDIVFVSAESIEAAHPQLKEKWFGLKSSVHLDSWMELNYADGHDIELVAGNAPAGFSDSALYFVNIGSYPPGRMEEAHTYLFLVGNSEAEIKQRAKALAPSDHEVPHKDNLCLVDDVIRVSIPGHHIRLTKAGASRVVPIYSEYCPL